MDITEDEKKELKRVLSLAVEDVLAEKANVFANKAECFEWYCI